MSRSPSPYPRMQVSPKPPLLPLYGAFPARGRSCSASPPHLPHYKSSSSQVSTCSSRSHSRSRRTSFDGPELLVQGRAVSRSCSPRQTEAQTCAARAPVMSTLRQVERAREESEMLGVSVEFLATEFLSEVEQHFGADADPDYNEINRILLHGEKARGANFICPRDGLPGSSYVDTLEEFHVGKASVLLSWCWLYTPRQVVDALLGWCESTGRDPSKTFVWQCALCLNQFRVEEKKARGESESSEVLREKFESRVRSTLHVVCLLDPWDDPVYIRRVWCIFELHRALCIEGCQLDVILPKSEEVRFGKGLRSDGLVAMWRVFEKLRIQDAEATVEADRKNILQIVDPDAQTAEDYDVSEKCSILNRAVIQRLQRWCVDTAAAQAAAVPTVSTCIRAASVLAASAEWSRADAVLSEARLSLETSGDAGTAYHIHVLSSLANLRSEQGLLEEAAELMAEALTAIEAETSSLRGLWDRRLEYASLLQSFGDVKDARGQLKQAVLLFEQAKNTYETVSAKDHTGYASVLLRLSGCCCRRGQLARATELLDMAMATAAEGPLTPSTAELLMAQGRLCIAKGCFAEASELLRSAKKAFQNTGATRKLGFAQLLLMLGFSFLEGGAAMVEAEQCFNEAREVLEEIGATSRLEYTSLSMYFGKLLMLRSRPEEALPHLKDAKAAFEQAACVETPEFAWLLMVLGRCHLQLGNTSAAMELFADSQSVFERADAGDAFAQFVLRNV
eukprot:TRINITY_DN23220_c0_g1_i1.p1 TRINITY_DN23220_c0_g1~~TRINITY_DN23220_c0_g1_i1.p1  ORF type:complete len:736 (+),score=166.09 TRINITY_DN23220_c0_g1_i1:49-2256(+)